MMVDTNIVQRNGPELIIGIVGALGTDLPRVEEALKRALERVDYTSEVISLIVLARSFAPWADRPDSPHYDEWLRDRMDTGNDFRRRLAHDGALALLAMAALRSRRRASTGDARSPIPRHAFILRSLRTPKEVEVLRRTYGDNCIIVAAYAPKVVRAERLAVKIAGSRGGGDWSTYLPIARELIQRDESERGTPRGQNVRETFPLADVFIDATHTESLEREVERFIQLLFGHPFRTPTRVEAGMFHAYGAAVRSASAGRQVGAAVTTADGELITVGTNEVAKAFGGQYWEADAPDGRDHERPYDSNTEMMHGILGDLLARMQRRHWLDASRAGTAIEDLVRAAREEIFPALDQLDPTAPASLADKAQLRDIIEFMRAVHAEMAAITSAARRGVSLQDTILFCTTFPCHECARLIVAAGIQRVVFIDPYPKSRVAELYDDSIAVDGPGDDRRVDFQAFVGVAPRRYIDLFTMSRRKDDDGRWLSWEEIRRTQLPRFGEQIVVYIQDEDERVAAFRQMCMAAGIPI